MRDEELFVATQKDRKRRKEHREKGLPRGRIPDDFGPKELMESKLRIKRGRAIYNGRETSVEPVFGHLVLRGLDRFLLGGKDGAAAEWSLFWATHNLLKLFRSGGRPMYGSGRRRLAGSPDELVDKPLEFAEERVAHAQNPEKLLSCEVAVNHFVGRTLLKKGTSHYQRGRRRC